ncbi:hypothetical protein PFLUV_G00100820 [Perca fluviatilis]|uniref:Uncharacterized protein n=1 Tax=Perca fluviatilis TaxID=8168 RepID=A0A6A5F771_PERFL|nr:hypothetical protein PFLUV_G00100820 [Perca fluviatilis]
MPSVLPTGDTLPVPGGVQRPYWIPGVWAHSEEPSWEMLPRHLKWLSWHTRMGQDLQASRHSVGTCCGTRDSSETLSTT